MTKKASVSSVSSMDHRDPVLSITNTVATRRQASRLPSSGSNFVFVFVFRAARRPPVAGRRVDSAPPTRRRSRTRGTGRGARPTRVVFGFARERGCPPAAPNAGRSVEPSTSRRSVRRGRRRRSRAPERQPESPRRRSALGRGTQRQIEAARIRSCSAGRRRTPPACTSLARGSWVRGVRAKHFVAANRRRGRKNVGVEARVDRRRTPDPGAEAHLARVARKAYTRAVMGERLPPRVLHHLHRVYAVRLRGRSAVQGGYGSPARRRGVGHRRLFPSRPRRGSPVALASVSTAVASRSSRGVPADAKPRGRG